MTVPNRRSKAESERKIKSIMCASGKLGENSNNHSEWLYIDELTDYTQHPFKLYEGERLDGLVQSIKEHGILQPVIVRPVDGTVGYEILSGHNRVNAARIAGLDGVPAIILKGLSDYEAKLIVTESNLIQRSFSDLSHSEKAISIKLHMDAIKCQGKRNDLIREVEELVSASDSVDVTSYAPVGHKSRDLTAQNYGLGSSTVARYLRIGKLIKPLLERMDNGKIAVRPAVDISYLTEDEQNRLDFFLDTAPCKIDMNKAKFLRQLSEANKLTDDKIVRILVGEIDRLVTMNTMPTLKIKPELYSKHFSPDTKLREMEVIIDEALTAYFQIKNNQKGQQENESVTGKQGTTKSA